MDACPACGKDRSLVGYRHLCVTEPIVTSVTKPVTVTKPIVTSGCKRCEELEAQVKELERRLLRRGAGRRPIGERAMTVAERQRRFRAKRKED